ncbi:MAG TPA: ferritin family protein [Azospirillum sp.]|nr:ferritin family protein [Azospirillum sp.]
MSDAINPDFPIGPIRTTEELMDLASGMEHDAAVRYEQLAGLMERRDEPALATLFRELAGLEREHEEGIARWAARDGLRRPEPARFTWRLPESFGDEADGAAAHVLTPYEALAIAVRNEERAFAFYTYVSAMAEGGEVKRRAESLAREELNHVALLRDWRRRSYHAMRPGRQREVPRSAAELRALAAGLERASVEVDEAAAAALHAGGYPEAAGLMRHAVEQARQRVAALAPPPGGPAPGTAAAEGARAAGLLHAGALTPGGALRLSLRDAEEAVSLYLETAERATDQRQLEEAQRLAGQAMGRLALVRSLMPDPDGG